MITQFADESLCMDAGRVNSEFRKWISATISRRSGAVSHPLERANCVWTKRTEALSPNPPPELSVPRSHFKTPKVHEKRNPSHCRPYLEASERAPCSD